MRLIKNKAIYIYIAVVFTCLILSSCSALKPCNCPGVDIQINPIENPQHS